MFIRFSGRNTLHWVCSSPINIDMALIGKISLKRRDGMVMVGRAPDSFCGALGKLIWTGPLLHTFKIMDSVFTVSLDLGQLACLSLLDCVGYGCAWHFLVWCAHVRHSLIQSTISHCNEQYVPHVFALVKDAPCITAGMGSVTYFLWKLLTFIVVPPHTLHGWASHQRRCWWIERYLSQSQPNGQPGRVPCLLYVSSRSRYNLTVLHPSAKSHSKSNWVRVCGKGVNEKSKQRSCNEFVLANVAMQRYDQIVITSVPMFLDLVFF